MSIKLEVRLAEMDPVNSKVLIQRHLNFDVRYQVYKNIVTHKLFLFNTDQVHTSVAKCCGGKCLLPLCRVAETTAGKSVEDCYNSSRDMEDPLIGKLMKINGLGDISFHDLDGSHPNLDLNWKRLRNMAQPVVDEALAKLAMQGKWEKQPIKLDLGVLLLDNRVIRIDNQSYAEMEQDKKKDLVQCEVSWKKNLDNEMKKRGITRTDDALVKTKKWKTVHKRDNKGNESSWTGAEMENSKDGGKTVKGEEEGEETNEGEKPVVQEDSKKEAKEPEDESDEWQECAECRETPCVWMARREEMVLFDQMEHAHLPEVDLPPNNIRRKKLYRQMTLIIQEGQVQKGVRHVLPPCVENGTRLMFPSPTFMGFKST
jgi:hypothetical protein